MSESGADDCVGEEKWEARGDGVVYSDLRHHFAYLAPSQFPAQPYRAEAATSCLYYMDEMRMHNGSYIDSSSVS